MALYEDLRNVDIISRLERDFKPHGPFWIDTETGLIKMDRVLPIKTPWVYVKRPIGNRCDKNFDILFNYFASDLTQPPIRCQDCWKVVVRPQTVAQLLQLHGLMVSIRDSVYGCKCGLEIRPNVNALYGGYFYNRGIDDGKKCLLMVRDHIHEQIDGEMPVLLKRGCTEMETAFGDSEKWHITPKQDQLEAFILCHFDFPEKEPRQPLVIQNHVRRSWIESACRNGDKTYPDFVDSPLHTTYKSY